jgi:hypothetical protein
MTDDQRKILIDELDRIIGAAAEARRCLKMQADSDAQRHMLDTIKFTQCLISIREFQSR